MARYRKALCKLCRREGEKLYLKGSKCDTAKCMLERRDFAPGQHGKRRKKDSEYGLQLREKQKLRRMYGVMENQFRLYFKRAHKMKGVTGSNLLQMLETRLDNVVFRLGFSAGRRSARQFVRHGHILINSKRVDIPSYKIKSGDKITIRDRKEIKKLVTDTIDMTASRPVPEWLQLNKEEQVGLVIRMPERGEITVPVDEHLIVELYSK